MEADMAFGNPLCTKCNDEGMVRGHWYSIWRDTKCPVCRGNPYAYRQSLKIKENPPSTPSSRKIIRNNESRIYNPHSTTTDNTSDNLFTNMLVMQAIMDGTRPPPEPPENVEFPSHKPHYVEEPTTTDDSHKHSTWSSDSGSSYDHSSFGSSSSYDSGSSFDSGSSSCDCGSSSGCD